MSRNALALCAVTRHNPKLARMVPIFSRRVSNADVVQISAFHPRVTVRRRSPSGEPHLSDGAHYFRWDAWGHLSEVDNSSSQLIRKHHYDAEGRRVRTEETVYGANGGTTVERLVYLGARLAMTFTESTNKDDMQTFGYAGGADGESFVVMTNSVSPLVDGSFALARDFQGSILALIDRTTKNVVERYRYGAFGQVSIEDASGSPLTESAYGNTRFFLGKPFDAEVGIYDLRARWYDPATGSFLSPDPLGPVDSWNLYQYGFGTPGKWMDPFGLQNSGGHGWKVDIDKDFEGASGKASKDLKRKLKKQKKEIEKREKKKVLIIALENANCAGGAYTKWTDDAVLIYISIDFWKNGGTADSIMALAKLAHEMKHAEQGDRTGLQGAETMEDYIDRRLKDEIGALDVESDFLSEAIDDVPDDIADEIRARSSAVFGYAGSGDSARNNGGIGAEAEADAEYIGGQIPTGSPRDYRRTLGDMFGSLGGRR